MDLKEADNDHGNMQSHWYYQAKYRVVSHLVKAWAPKRVLDVGAGAGLFSRLFLLQSSVETACCVDPHYSDDRDELVDQKSMTMRRAVSQTDADLVLMMDVLEHVDDDLGLLNQYVQMAEVGTRFLITVPAFDWLWSEHDVYLEHRRRYNRAQLQSVVLASGLTIHQSGYFFGLILIPVALLRLTRRWVKRTATPPGSDLQPSSAWVNKVMGFFCKLEYSLAGLNRFFGLSVVCLAEKPPEPLQLQSTRLGTNP